jgi:hypothetical protein
VLVREHIFGAKCTNLHEKYDYPDQQHAGQPAGLVAAEQPAFVPDDVDDMVRKLPTLAELEVYMPPSAAQVSDADLDGGPTLRLLLPDGTVQRRAAVVAIRTFDQKGSHEAPRDPRIVVGLLFWAILKSP